MTDSKLAKQAVLPRRALYKPAPDEIRDMPYGGDLSKPFAGPLIAKAKRKAKPKKAKKR